MNYKFLINYHPEYDGADASDIVEGKGEILADAYENALQLSNHSREIESVEVEVGGKWKNVHAWIELTDVPIKLSRECDVRQKFWSYAGIELFEKYHEDGKSQNDYPTDIRCMFVDWLDQVHRDGVITDKMANDVTLG